MMPFVPWTHPHRLGAVDSAALVVRLAAGDAAALDELYRREAGPVYRYALALGGNAAWAADATQEAFVALATRPQGFDAARGALGAYLAGVARHALVGTELQRERLPALGLPYDPARAGETVRAELLLHPSGEVLAVRLLN